MVLKLIFKYYMSCQNRRTRNSSQKVYHGVNLRKSETDLVVDGTDLVVDGKFLDTPAVPNFRYETISPFLANRLARQKENYDFG
jgi:hypothetical protein